MAMTLPTGWRRMPLSEFIVLQRGLDLPHRERVPGAYKVLSSGEAFGSHNVGPVKGPGFVVGRATNIGKPTWSDNDYWPLNTVLYAKDFLGNDRKFAYYWFLSHDLTAYNSGSVQPMLNRNYIANVPICAPPLPEQRAIAATLGALDDKIESNRRAIDLAENLGDAIFSGVASEGAALSSVAELTMGSSPPGESYNDSGDGLPFYQGVRDFGRRFPGLRVWTTAPVRVAEPNDSLVSVRAPVGDLNRAATRCCIGRGVAAVRSEWPSTVYYALRAASDLWEPFQQEGTVFGAINRSDLSSAKIDWFRDGNLRMIEQALSAIDERIASLSREVDALTTLRDTLLPELLSGQIRVPVDETEAEATIRNFRTVVDGQATH
jgi:type I restriction enzyme S subunit